MATDVATPYIETLLKRVVARGGNMGVRFETGAPVRVTDGNGAPRDVTTRPLSAQEILSAVAPIVPEDVKPQLHQQPETAFDYVCAGVGAFTVMVRREGEQVSVAIDPASGSAPPTAPVVTPVAEPTFVVETTAGQAIVIGSTESGSGLGIRDSGFEVRRPRSGGLRAHAYSSRKRSRSQALARFSTKVLTNSSVPTAKIVRYLSVPCGVSPMLTCTI